MHRALLLPASLSALAATTAAAQGGEQVYFTIKLENAHIADIGNSPGEQIAVRSFEWGGTRGTTAYKLDRVFVKSWSTSGDADGVPPRGGSGEWVADVERPAEAGKLPGKRTPPTVTLKRGMTTSTATTGGGKATSDMAMKGSKVGENSVAGDPDRPLVAGRVPNRSGRTDTVDKNETITIHGGRTEDAGTAGSPRYNPYVTTDYVKEPLENGSVWVRVSSPWTACRVGTRYPLLEMAGGGKTYVMRDVTVSSCGAAISPDEVAFSYKTIKFDY